MQSTRRAQHSLDIDIHDNQQPTPTPDEEVFSSVVQSFLDTDLFVNIACVYLYHHLDQHTTSSGFHYIDHIDVLLTTKERVGGYLIGRSRVSRRLTLEAQHSNQQICNGVRAHNTAYGPVSVLLLQPGPQPREQAAWSLYASPAWHANGCLAFEPRAHDTVPTADVPPASSPGTTDVPAASTLCRCADVLPTAYACVHATRNASRDAHASCLSKTALQACGILSAAGAGSHAAQHWVLQPLPFHAHSFGIWIIQLC